MLIQFQILQNYAPSNLNRDNTGSPKDSILGGYRRGRISSQCLKRSIRRSEMFREAIPADLLAKRTQRLPHLVDQQLQALGADEQARETITKRLPELGGGKAYDEKKGGEPKTSLLIFLSNGEIETITAQLWALYQEKGDKTFGDKKALPIKEIEAAVGHLVPRSVDVAIFGRMTTSAAFEDVHAAVQVAHAISTNKLDRKFDYFTAIDDLKEAHEDAGAGMIGDVEFNSSTYYQYINIHWEKLLENLGGDVEMTRNTVLALLEAAVFAQPSGKQNSFAAQNLPDFVCVELRERNIPINYANAFMKPVDKSHQQSLMQNSITQLDEYVQSIQQMYAIPTQTAYISTQETAYTATKQPSLPALKQWLDDTMKEVIDGQNG